MLKIGLTGGIGSGKSTVAKVFETLRIPVYRADYEARRLMEENTSLRDDIITVFGEKAYQDGILNRSYLASVVFNDHELLEKLNAIVHPLVRIDFRHWVERQLNCPYIVQEAAILFESGHFRDFDYCVVVNAQEELRIRRVMARDSVSEGEVYKRISRQMPQKFKMILGDFFIYNNEDNLILPQVLELHNKFLSLHRK